MSRRGFTLAEMMVTLAVISVMAAMSVPAFTRMTSGTRQGAAVREVFMLVQEARTEARGRNQAVRFDVTSTVVNGSAVQEVRWGRLPCGDAWGRTCPSAACASSTTCGGSCVCESRSEAVRVPAGVTMTNVSGLCFLGSTAEPHGARCNAADPTVTMLRFDLKDQPAPWLVVLDAVSGVARLVDCARVPKDGSCP